MKVKEGVHDERERNTNMKRQIEIQKLKARVIETDFGNCGSEKKLEVKGWVNRKIKKSKETNRIKPKQMCAWKRREKEKW